MPEEHDHTSNNLTAKDRESGWHLLLNGAVLELICLLLEDNLVILCLGESLLVDDFVGGAVV